MKIKITIMMASALAMLALLTGCAGFGHTGPSPDEMRAFVNTLSKEASQTAATIDLAENPNHRTAYEAAVVGLQSLVDRTNYSSAAFVAVLDRLPAKLTGTRGAVVIGAINLGVSLWNAVNGTWIDVKSAPYVEASLKGVLAGLQAALTQTVGETGKRGGGETLKALKAAQCIVPARK